MKYVMPSAVLLPDDTIPMLDPDGNGLTTFEVDSRPVVIPATKGRIMRHRPRLNSWASEFSLEVDEDLVDAALVHDCLAEGGSRLGIGDYRPEKGGPYGRFQITSWAVAR